MTIYFLHCIHIIEHNVNVSNTACCWNEWSCHLQSVYAVLRQKWAEAIIRNCCIRCRPITFCSEKQATNWFTTILSRISANQENNMYICLDSFFFFLSLIAVNSYLMIFAAENWSVGGFIQHRGVKNELMSLSNGKCQTGNDRMKHGHTACLWHEEDFIRKNQACRMCNDDKVDRLVDDDTKKNMHRKWTINGNYFISMHNMYEHWAWVTWTPHHNDDELEAIHRAPS